MKKIISILLLFGCFSGYGQKDTLMLINGDCSGGSQQHSPGLFLDASGWQTIKYDTSHCIMLVCDTTKTEKLHEYYIEQADMGKNTWRLNKYNDAIYWKYGYEVNHCWEFASMSGCDENVFDENFKQFEYLDADKKPLSKSIIVWQSKNIK
jgi:hypothetical protein